MRTSAAAGKSPPAISARDRRRQQRLRLLGTLILTAGLAAALWIYRRAAVPDEPAEYLVASGTLLSGKYKQAENQLKQIGGQSNVVAAEFSDWFVSLWHGRRLAGTITVLALGGSLACFFAAHLLNFPPPPDPPSARD